MKILIAATGAPGHLNPLLAAGSVLCRHHEVGVQVAKELRPQVEGAQLRYFPEQEGKSTFGGSFQEEHSNALASTVGIERAAYVHKHYFAANMATQAANLQHTMREFPADLILADSSFYGTLPLLLGPHNQRPAVIHLGVSIPNVFSGKNRPFRPDCTAMELSDETEQHARIILNPVQAAFDRALQEMGLGPLPCPALESMSLLPDLYVHSGIRSFDYPGSRARVQYIGRLPMARSQCSMPSWWHTLDRSKRTILVTQGTVANRDLTQLIGPTLTGLAETDLNVLVTTGGSPITSIPREIPKNAYVASFLPFEEIFPHVDILVTNGGYGTVNMALAHGVPIVTAGLTADKEEVSALVQWTGVGIDLRADRTDPETVRRAVQQALDMPDYGQRAKDMAREFASVNAEEALLASVSQALRR
jgi:UDP:flavonoid glycosyltransferase YjiC (YdhE family)